MCLIISANSIQYNPNMIVNLVLDHEPHPKTSWQQIKSSRSSKTPPTKKTTQHEHEGKKEIIIENSFTVLDLIPGQFFYRLTRSFLISSFSLHYTSSFLSIVLRFKITLIRLTVFWPK